MRHLELGPELAGFATLSTVKCSGLELQLELDYAKRLAMSCSELELQVEAGYATLLTTRCSQQKPQPEAVREPE